MALEAVKGEKTVAQLAAEYEAHSDYDARLSRTQQWHPRYDIDERRVEVSRTTGHLTP